MSPNPPDSNLDVEIEVEKCPTCDTELEVDGEGGVYCPSPECPRFMITDEDEEINFLDDDDNALEEDDD